MPERGKEGRLADIFLTMSYNERESEDFFPILNWLSNRSNVLTSILGGNWLDAATTPSGAGKKDEFLVGPKPVSISYLATKELDTLLKSKADAKFPPEPSLLDSEVKDRIQKFLKVVEGRAVELSIAESLATSTPLWQIREYDVPTWSHQINSANRITSLGVAASGAKVGLIPLGPHDYSIKNILTLLSALIQSDGEFSLLASSGEPAAFLPTAILIEALNKAKIRKAPIDLLLFDPSAKENVQLLEKVAKATPVLLWGSAPSTYATGIFSGVLLPNHPARAAHFILDSSADVETAVEAIVAEAWCSGSNVHGRARSLLFVHQPLYNSVRQLLEKRMSGLKTSLDVGLKSVDFIKRSPSSIDSGKKSQGEELKTFPPKADFSLPTLVWEIGTSCDLIASRTPGLGHLLFAIPYRSRSELLSLANNYGDENQVFIFSSDVSFVKEVGSAIKGTLVRVNSRSGGETLPSPHQDLNRLEILQPSNPITQSAAKIVSCRDEFAKSLGGGEKALKTWESVGIENRLSLAVQLFLSMGGGGGGELDKLHYLTDLMKVGFGLGAELKNKDSLLIHQNKPFGVCGLLLVNPEEMTNPSPILPILLLILKGNVSIVTWVSEVESPVVAALTTACNSILPPGVVQFIRCPSVPSAVDGLSSSGKVPMLWILHPGKTALAHIPPNAFSKVVVDDVRCLEKSISCRAKELGISKIIVM